MTNEQQVVWLSLIDLLESDKNNFDVQFNGDETRVYCSFPSDGISEIMDITNTEIDYWLSSDKTKVLTNQWLIITLTN